MRVRAIESQAYCLPVPWRVAPRAARPRAATDVVVGQETDTFGIAGTPNAVRCEAPPGTVVAQTETNPGGGFDLGILPTTWH